MMTTNMPFPVGVDLLKDSNSSSLHPWGDTMYPSGYSTLRIVLTSVVVTVIMVLVVVGNMLVIIAIARDKALKGLQNWFIASLAVADIMIGLVIMPFSLAKELMGYWVFGDLWCNLHAAIDVLACSSSINNICLISLDRYWSITQAVDYIRTRTPRRAAAMIAFVWLFSGLISIPPLLGWKKNLPQTDLPMCELSDDIGYVLYSALGSFYIPSVIMIFVYIRIYFAARSRARRYVKRKPRAPAARTCNTTAVEVHRQPADGSMSREGSSGRRAVASCNSPALRQLDQLEKPSPPPEDASSADKALKSETTSQMAAADEDEGSSIESAQAVEQAPSKRRFRLPFFSSGAAESHEMTPMSRTAAPRPSLPNPIRDAEREKRRIARYKEKRATLILGLIMGSFIACWLPFFILYVLTAFCTSCVVADWGFAFAFWLGYLNSALNPVIYTIFNKDFRKAFRKIVFK